MITERYRQDYDGEFVISEVRVADGRTTQTREWIPNAITNHHISGRAAVIGSDLDRRLFEWRRLYRHKGGLLAKKKLQTYGQATMCEEMPFDFMVAGDGKAAKHVLKSSQTVTGAVFASASICLQYPGRFYLVPYLPAIDPLAQAIYLAAFDGHQEIFMLGYNNATPSGNKNWQEDVAEVIQTYSNTQFYAVGRGDIPNRWQECDNLQDMQYRKFITYCDI